MQRIGPRSTCLSCMLRWRAALLWRVFVYIFLLHASFLIEPNWIWQWSTQLCILLKSDLEKFTTVVVPGTLKIIFYVLNTKCMTETNVTVYVNIFEKKIGKNVYEIYDIHITKGLQIVLTHFLNEVICRGASFSHIKIWP